MQLGTRTTTTLALALTLASAACTARETTPDGRRAGPTPRVTPTPIARVTNPPGGWFETACALPLEQLLRIRRGLYGDRSPDVVYVPREPNHFPNNHSGPWDYLQDVPLLLYGPGYIRPLGTVRTRPAPTVADLAPTFAELLDLSWPRRRGGRVLRNALVPSAERRTPPRLLMTIVWDGGGSSGLDAWPQSTPHLRDLARSGAFFDNATVGSSPSVTPAVHATIGTGAFPSAHGVTDIFVAEGEQMVPVFGGKSTRRLELPTLADLFDQASRNRARVGLLAYKGWHLAMMGHGAELEGGDPDLAAIVEQDGSLSTNATTYSLPRVDYGGGISDDVAKADASDGRRDGRWLNNDVLDSAEDYRDTPVWVTHQTDVILDILRTESFGADSTPDLFYTNYKQIDQVGHRWGMLEPEMHSILAATDAQLPRLVEWLNDNVGRRRWVLALTADHGPAPDLKAVRGWPLHMETFRSRLAEALGGDADDLFLDTRASGLWFRGPAARSLAEETAAFITDYRIADDAPGGEIPPTFEERRDEPVFSAAFPAEAVDDVIACRRESE